MSVTTSTKSFRDMTRREAIDLCYILEEQRDRVIEQHSAVLAIHEPVRWDRSTVLCSECVGGALWPCATARALGVTK